MSAPHTHTHTHWWTSQGLHCANEHSSKCVILSVFAVPFDYRNPNQKDVIHEKSQLVVFFLNDYGNNIVINHHYSKKKKGILVLASLYRVIYIKANPDQILLGVEKVFQET